MLNQSTHSSVRLAQKRSPFESSVPHSAKIRAGSPPLHKFTLFCAASFHRAPQRLSQPFRESQAIGDGPVVWQQVAGIGSHEVGHRCLEGCELLREPTGQTGCA